VVLQALVRLDTLSGHFDRARAYGAEALAITEASGRDVLRAVVLSTLFHVYAWQDPEREVRASIKQGIALAERTGALAAIPDMQWAHGILDLSTGHVESAAARLGDGRARTLAMGVDHPVVFRFLVDEIDALVLCGRIDEADDLLSL